MSDCSFCRRPAGFFHSVHAECQKTHDQALSIIPSAVLSSITQGGRLESLRAEIDSVARTGFVPQDQVEKLAAAAWVKVLDQHLSAGQLSGAEESRLASAASLLRLTKASLEAHHVTEKVAGAKAMTAMMDGTFPSYPLPFDNLPFNFQAKEEPVWLFRSTTFLEEKTRRESYSESYGASFSMGHGMRSYHGRSRRYSIERTGNEEQGFGVLCLTNKNVLFAGTGKPLKVPYNKIISFEMYIDGFGFTKEMAQPKHYLFATHQGSAGYYIARYLAQTGNVTAKTSVTTQTVRSIE